ncbi:MAG: hypothetical protein HYY40_04190 [Bacteroidetes bacterium]|nr:hypothetical protein [Bacteroidota bacterium]
MKTTTGILFAGLILSFGCNQTDSGNTENQSTENTAVQIQNNQVNPPVDSSIKTGTTIENSNVPLTTENASSSDKPNPAHGQPGHRCDIPVGSPLNSPPGNTSAAAPPVSSTPIKTAPGMNPPHGQPGHDCKIAVGAPLNK